MTDHDTHLKQRRDKHNARPYFERKDKHLRATYGIGADTFYTILEVQGWCCPICDKPYTDGPEFHLEHSHTTGEIRGVVCSPCNTGLGLLRADYDLTILKKAYEYAALNHHDNP